MFNIRLRLLYPVKIGLNNFNSMALVNLVSYAAVLRIVTQREGEEGGGEKRCVTTLTTAA